MAHETEIRQAFPTPSPADRTADCPFSDAILHMVRQPVLVLDAGLRVTAANPAFLDTFDIDAADTLGRGLFDLADGDWDIPTLRALLQDALPHSGVVRDVRIEHAFGRLGRRVMLVNACRVLRDGRLDHILLTIDDRTQAEADRWRLEGEKEFVEKIVDASRDALLVLDWDLQVQRANETFYRRFRAHPSQTVGRRVFELGDGQWDIPDLRRLLETVLPKDKSFDDFEVVHDFAGLGHRRMVLNARRVDHLQYILLAIEDRTETHLALAARDQTAAQFKALVAASSDMIFTMSADWSVCRMHPGHNVDVATCSGGFDWLEHIPAPDRDEVRRRFQDAIALRMPYEGQHRIIQPDGSIRWIASRAVPMIAPDGTVTEWFGAASDITARVDAEAALRQSEEHQRFLLKLSDALRPISDPAEIEGLACRLLAEWLGVDRAYFVDLDWTLGSARVLCDQVRDDARSLVGEHAIDDFGWTIDILRDHDSMRVSDMRRAAFLPDQQRAAAEALGIVAVAAVPLVKEGVLQAALCVTTSHPRQWRDGEIDILRGVASRIWAAVQAAQADRKRRESDARYRLLFNSIDQGFCVIRVDFAANGRAHDYTFLEVNAAFERQTGLSDAQGCSARTLMPDLEDVWFETYGRITRTRQAERFEEVVTTLGAHYDVYAFPVGKPEARQVGILFTDVATRKRAERALRDSEARLAAIFKEASVGLCEIDATGRILRANHELARILQRPIEALVSQSVADVTHPDDLGPSFAMIGRVLRGTTDPADHADETSGAIDGGIDKRYIRPDGSMVWANSRATLLPGHDGKAPTLLVVTVDLTQRKAAEAAIRESEERFRQFGNASSDALWVWNVETRRWEYLSAAFSDICGIDSVALLEDGGLEDFARVIHPEDSAAAIESLRTLIGGPASFDFRIIHPSDGQIRWLRITGFALSGNDGTVRRLGGIIHDMTEEVRISGRMKVLMAELQHRTRNLIAVVRAMSTRTLKTSASLQEYNLRFGSRLEALARVNGLLSRLEDGDRVTIDELLLAEFKSHGIVGRDSGQVRISGPDGVRLPSASVQTLALALHELLTNATKHGALSRPDGRLTVEWKILAGKEPQLQMVWCETGITPPVAQQTPARYGGYGRELIERALPYQLGAQTDYRLDETGLICSVTLPLPPRLPEPRHA